MQLHPDPGCNYPWISANLLILLDIYACNYFLETGLFAVA